MDKQSGVAEKKILAALDMHYPSPLDRMALSIRLASHSRAAITRALSCLCKAGKIEKVSFGMYRVIKENANA